MIDPTRALTVPLGSQLEIEVWAAEGRSLNVLGRPTVGWTRHIIRLAAGDRIESHRRGAAARIRWCDRRGDGDHPMVGGSENIRGQADLEGECADGSGSMSAA